MSAGIRVAGAFRDDALPVRLRPFLIAITIAFASLPLAGVKQPLLVGLAALLTAVAGVVILAVRRETGPAVLATFPPLAIVAVAFLMREATGGGSDVGLYESLIGVPLLWVALHGTRRLLVVVLAAVTLGFALTAVGGDAGSAAWLKVLLWPAIAGPIGLSLQRLVEENRALLLTDPLTGVANRRRWELELPREMARTARSGQPLTIAMIDIDHFKAHNDELGHVAGDRLLREAAADWSAVLRGGDLLARLGGDEFAVMLPETDAQEAEAVLARLREATPAPITCSAGLAPFGNETHPSELLASADRALYQAKSSGRNRTGLSARTTVAAA